MMGDINSARQGAGQKIGQSIEKGDAETLTWGGSTNDYEFVALEDQGSDRWSSYALVVFRDKEDGELLCFQYGTGLTEYQDYIIINGETHDYWGESGFDYVKVFPATLETVTKVVYSRKEN